MIYYIMIIIYINQLCYIPVYRTLKGEVSPNNNVDWVSRKQFYKPNSKSFSRFG